MEAAYCFPSIQRLKKPAEFTLVFKKATWRYTSVCFVVLGRTNNLGSPRLGMSISKRCIPKAVARNRLKRQLRERFRHCHHGLPALDLVWLARQGIAHSTPLQLRLEIDQLWQDLYKA